MKKRVLLFIMFFITIFSISNFSNAYYTSSYKEPAALLKMNSRGEGVKWLQDMLNHNGYSLTVDGIFGSNTLNAVKIFQSKVNITVDGIVGTQTRSKLKEYGTSTTSINAYRYTSANVNFRSGPSTGYSSLGILAKDTKVYVVSKRSDGWSYVKYNNKYGYIYSQYLKTSITTNALPKFNRTAKSLIGIIKNCKAYYANNNFYYSLAAGVRTIPADNSKTYEGKRYVDCSSFTSWVLYEYALANENTAMKNYFSTQKTSSTFASIGANGGNSYLSVIDRKSSNRNADLANAREGDILVTNGHVEFFKSYVKNTNGTLNIKVYNCGSDSSIKASGATTSATKKASEILYILRVK